MDTKDISLDKVSQEDIPVANVVVAGITGTGKSTLINAIFGEELAATGSGRPVTDRINEYKNGDIPIHIWDTVGLELDSNRTKESIKDTIANKATTKNKYDIIHAIWYCINSGSNRYQGAELDFIHELHSLNVPFIIVLTQCYGSKKTISEFEDKIHEINDSMGMRDIDVIRVLAQDYEFEIDDGQILPKKHFGLEDLINTTVKKMPDFIKIGFIAAQQVSKVQKRAECENIIYKYVMAAQMEIFQNLPVIRLFTTDSRIMRMFRNIGEMYRVFLTDEKIQYIMDRTQVNWENRFGALTFTKLSGYGDKINNLLSTKRSEGYDVKVDELSINNKVGRMIAYYGYVFVESIEEVWEESTKKELKDIDIICHRLIGIINDKLRQNRKENF